MRGRLLAGVLLALMTVGCAGGHWEMRNGKTVWCTESVSIGGWVIYGGCSE